MKISYQWLQKYIGLSHSAEELKDILTFSGIEVEGMESLNELPATIISALVLSAEKVEGSDHLQVCQVDTGSEVLQVVCGAANCSSGMTAILALPGTVLGEITIKKAKIRGVESSGMLCSERELGLSENHDGIIELEKGVFPGTCANEIFGLPDTIFELEITPNRSDLLGYLGIARDLSASTKTAIKIPSCALMEAGIPTDDLLSVKVRDPKLCPRYTARVVKGVKIAASPRWLQNYLLKTGLRPINNVVDITNYVMLEAGHPLHAFDLNCLDIGKEKKQIIIRPAHAGEVIRALDSKSYELDNSDLVIADSDKAIAIAGVIGGEDSSINDSTVDIVLEAAAFNAGSIRRTSYKHKINTDSSYRFERHLSEYGVEYASDRAAQLILRIAGGKLCPGRIDDWQNPSSSRILGIRPTRYEKLIGYELSGERIIQYLSALGCEFLQYANWKAGEITSVDELYCFHAEQIKQGITEFTELDDCMHSIYFRIPHYRIDLEREIDLIEELARLDGYDKVPRKTSISLIMDRHAHQVKRKLQDIMIANGCFEAVNFSFEDPERLGLLGYDVRAVEMQILSLRNPQSSNMSVMRSSLLPQLLGNVQYNINHGTRNIRLFELNKTYIKTSESNHTEPYRLCAILSGLAQAEHWQQKQNQLTFFDIKAIAEEILTAFRMSNIEAKDSALPYLVSSNSLSFYANGTHLITIGKILPEIASRFGIDVLDLKQDLWLLDLEVENLISQTRNQEQVFELLPKYPAVERDISFLISEDVSYSAIRAKIMQVDTAIIKNVDVFDEYRGKQIPEGFRSLSLHLLLNDSEKTLTVQRIDQLVDSIVKMLLSEWQIKMR